MGVRSLGSLVSNRTADRSSVRDLQIEVISWFMKRSGTDQIRFGKVPQSAQD